ncbi:MAG: alpha/beta hydrolase [Lactococcus chungangensis]
MKNKIAIILSLLFMSVIAYYGHNWVINMDDKESKLRNSRLKPIIFIPGSNADINRFNSLISKLNNTEPKHSILKVQVNTDGSLDYFGSLNSKDLRPFIVIGFKRQIASPS